MPHTISHQPEHIIAIIIQVLVPAPYQSPHMARCRVFVTSGDRKHCPINRKHASYIPVHVTNQYIRQFSTPI